MHTDNVMIIKKLEINMHYVSRSPPTARCRPGQRVVGVLKVAPGRRWTSRVSVCTVSYRRPWSVGSVPRHLIFHAVIRV